MKDNTAAYQAFYDSWTSEHGAPPSVLDWSSCRNERRKFGTWARRRLLPLSPGRNFVGSKFRKFYHEWLATHGNPPSAKDYEGKAKERAAFNQWAKRAGLALAPNDKDTPWIVRIANAVEPLCNAGLTRREIAARLGMSLRTVERGIWFLTDDPTDVEDDPRACEPPEVKELCDQLRARDCIPPKLLPEMWTRYLEVRAARINGDYLNQSEDLQDDI